MIVKTIFLCNISIRRKLCLKLQKIAKGNVMRHMGNFMLNMILKITYTRGKLLLV